MTTDNQTTTQNSIEEMNYSKATRMVRNVTAKAVDKDSSATKTLSLRPTKSVTRNNSFRPVKKIR
jgi:hypothetical protein